MSKVSFFDTIYKTLMIWRMKVFAKIKMIFQNIKQDIKNFNRDNADEHKVLDAHYFSAYKRVFVLKAPIGYSGASYGIILVGNKVKDVKLVKHEYGHYLQLKQNGILRYTKEVAIPSVRANIKYRKGKLGGNYYSLPWEAEADRLGGVQRK